MWSAACGPALPARMARLGTTGSCLKAGGGGARVSLQGVRGRGGPGDSGCAGGGPVPHETPRGGGRGQPRLPNGQQELGGDRVQGWTPTVWGSRRAGFKSAPQKAV